MASKAVAPDRLSPLRITWSGLSSRPILFGISLLAAIVVVGLFVRMAAEFRYGIGDFDAYYSASMAARHGESMYQQAIAWRDANWANNSPIGIRPVGGQPYPYPPALAIAILPLTFLPVNISIFVWFTIVFLSVIGSAYILTGLLLPLRGLQRVTATLGASALMMLFQPVRASFTSAQVDGLLLLLLCLSLAAFARRRDGRAGFWLALAASVKLPLGLVVLLFLWKRAYRGVAVVAVVSALLLFAPIVVFGPGMLREFIDVSIYYASPGYGTDPTNQALYGLWLRLFTVNPYTIPVIVAPLLPTVLKFLGAAAVLLVLVLTITRSRALPIQQLALEYGLVIAGALLISPLSEDIHFTQLLIPLFAATATLALAWPRGRSALILGIAVAGAYLYLCIPSLRTLHMASYSFYQAPLQLPGILLTGVHTYGLIAAAVVTLLIVQWHRGVLRARQP